MTPTKAETAINHATVEADGTRTFYKGESDVPQFRVTPTEGGYFMEEALGGGRFWVPRAYQLTDSGIGAENIPDRVWARREKWATDQAAAAAVLREHKIDPASPVADYELAPDVPDDVADAGRTLRGLQYLLVWPAEAVAEHIGAYEKQWSE